MSCRCESMSRYLGTLEVGAYRGRPQMGRGPRGRAPGRPQGNFNQLQPLGLGSVTFTASSGTVLSASQPSQKLFHPQRLIIDIARTGGSATGLVTVTGISVGADNQLASSAGTGALPASMFANIGVDLNVNFATATPGITIAVQLTISAAPSASDTVACAVGMLGSTPAQSAPQAQFSRW